MVLVTGALNNGNEYGGGLNTKNFGGGGYNKLNLKTKI